MKKGERIKVLCLAGPTGTGKSELALALADALPVEIISVDSAMIYRGMDIGTAKPDRAVRARVPHHLIDIRDPAETYNAAGFARDAVTLIRDIHGRGRLPLLVGGTLLYFRALMRGLSPVPGAEPGLRAAIRNEAETRGWVELHGELAHVDPASAARIHVNDRQRLERALELYRLTGTPPSRLYERADAGAPFEFTRLALWPADRAQLYAQLTERFHGMLAAGLIEEVRALHARGDLGPAHPAVRVLGYRQLWAWLDGECELAEAERRAITATRRYAKRQLTWLRSEPQWLRIEADAGAKERILAAARGEVSSVAA
ncbi:MAG: tRNA (adenosine(37)-N6)-dimethylallyltransferase MiaA [Gammaproteobacteria bacterium]